MRPCQLNIVISLLIRFALRCSLALLVALPGLAVAEQDPPQLPPVLGETRMLQDQFVRHQIAPPLAQADGSAWLFQRDGDGLVLWHVFPLVPQATERLPQPELKLVLDSPRHDRFEARYASVETSAGRWLLGPTLALMRPDGRSVLRKSPRPRSGMRALPLQDGGVLVLGGDSWKEPRDPRASVQVERVSLQPDGSLSIEPWPDLPVKIDGTGSGSGFYDFSALVLRDGHVLVTGGEYRATTWLWQPGEGRWEAVPGVDITRDRPALIELPDGRVWATGGSWMSGRPEMANSSSLWDPVQRRWTPGPRLPVPMQGHQAVWSADRRTILLGGAQQAPLLAWTPGEPEIHIAAAPTLQRYKGVLVPLPDGRVAVVSGVHAHNYEEAYGRRSSGASIFEIASDANPAPVRQPLWTQVHDGARAVHNRRLVALGGRLVHAQHGSVDEDAIQAVELEQLDTGRVRTLAPLPWPLRWAQVEWLDDHRVIAVGQRRGDGPDGFVGILDLATNRWQELDASAFDSRRLRSDIHGATFLLCVDNQRSYLASDDGTLTWINSTTLQRESMSSYERARRRDGPCMAPETRFAHRPGP